MNLAALLDYSRRFYLAAKGKLTTWVALLTAGLSELIGTWDQSVALLPHWIIEHKPHIVAASALLAIWTRIRKEI